MPSEELTYDDSTMQKIYDSIAEFGIPAETAKDLVNSMQNKGILFRERATQEARDWADLVDAVEVTLTPPADSLPAIYMSSMAVRNVGSDKPENVWLCGEQDGGWWLWLPATWPSPDWRGTTRWFTQAHGATLELITEAPS
jgi:hypothetical protein